MDPRVEALTHPGHGKPVPDARGNDAARHLDEKALAVPVVEIAAIHVLNRFNLATRPVAGEWTP